MTTPLLEKSQDLEVIHVQPEEAPSHPSRLFTWIAIFAMVVGAGSMLGGLAGFIYTYDQASDQNITTPDDAYFAEVPVRGPFSMWAQSDIITTHQLDRTDGLYYSEMDRQVPMLDENGEAVLDDAGEVVMVPNEARTSWLSATTLTTALGLGILAYALSFFAFVMGGLMLALGFGFLKLRDRAPLTT